MVLNKKIFLNSSSINKDDFIKICLSPDNKLIPDLCDKLPGKSVWLPADKALIVDILRKEDLEYEKAASKVNLIDVMKIKNLASRLNVDIIIIKRHRVSFIFFNDNKNTKTKQDSVLFLLNKLNEEKHQTDVKEKETQLSVVCFSLGSVAETLIFLKKTTKKQQ